MYILLNKKDLRSVKKKQQTDILQLRPADGFLVNYFYVGTKQCPHSVK